MTNKETIVRSRGNIFADLGVDNPDEELDKARVAAVVRDLILSEGLSQKAAADRMGIAQPDVSKVLNAKLGGLSLERLISFIRALGRDVEISVSGAKGRNGQVVVRSTASEVVAVPRVQARTVDMRVSVQPKVAAARVAKGSEAETSGSRLARSRGLKRRALAGDIMAKTTGDEYRKGSVDDRTQVQTLSGNSVKWKTGDGRLMDQKKGGEPSKGVAKEKDGRRK